MNEAALAQTCKQALAQRLADIPASPALRLLPVRHHSPACAWQLRALIRRERPQRILIEGPPEADALLRYLALPGARPPLALYACLPAPSAGEHGRHAFYPFAEFSPEWVALREGLRYGAQVSFIDRPAAALLEALEDEDEALDDEQFDQKLAAEPSLLRDDGLGEGELIQRLLAASGCSDFDHWWDRHFEAGAQALAPLEWFMRLQQWCLLLRDKPAVDDCGARERAMAAHVAAARASGERTLVIVGGLHVEAIAVLLAQNESPPVEAPDGRAQCYLMPYSLQRLDSAQDYAAGLPDTGYYQQLWQALESSAEQPARRAAEAAALQVSAALRERGEAVGVPDAIEAVLMGQRLAELRQGPLGRAEILDALAGALPAAAFDSDTEHARRRQLRALLAADRSGKLPRQYPRAPLVEDFRRRAQALGLPLLPKEAPKRALDLYRSEKHREISRLLHQLDLLEAGYAELVAGPDFVSGSGLERVHEQWLIGWRPEVEARLTECQHLGAQLPEGALNLLQVRARRHRSEAPTCLLLAMRMGLHEALDGLLQSVQSWAQHEGALAELVEGLARLAAALRASEVLASARLPQLPAVLSEVYQRALSLLPWLGQMNSDAALQTMQALATLNTLASESWAELPALLDALEAIADAPLPALLRGRIAGILGARGRLSQAQCAQRLRQALDSGLLQPAALSDYLLGFLPLARQVLLGEAALIEAFNEALLQWPEPTFLEVLPGLRLAFTSLKPQESAQLLQALAGGEEADQGAPELDAAALATLARVRAESARIGALWGLDA